MAFACPEQMFIQIGGRYFSSWVGGLLCNIPIDHILSYAGTSNNFINLLDSENMRHFHLAHSPANVRAMKAEASSMFPPQLPQEHWNLSYSLVQGVHCLFVRRPTRSKKSPISQEGATVYSKDTICYIFDVPIDIKYVNSIFLQLFHCQHIGYFTMLKISSKCGICLNYCVMSSFQDQHLKEALI